MKKVLIGALALSLFACNKKSDLVVEAQPDTNSTTQNAGMGAKWEDATVSKGKPNTTYDRRSGYCNGYPANCSILGEVVITAKTIARTKEEAKTAIQAGSFFTTEELEQLAPHIPADYFRKLVSGQYYVALSAMNEHSVCYIAGKSKKLNRENAEFAFQFDIAK